jgi:uncharacterized protein (DUF2062 family)
MKKRIAGKLAQFSLRQIPPEQVALSVALGLTLGVFPVYGVPTVLCIAAAVVWRPNVPLLHAINGVTSPLQFALLVPFHRVGALVVPGVAPTMASNGWYAAAVFSNCAARLIAGWLLVSVPAGITLYVVLSSVLRRRAGDCQMEFSVN